MTFSLSSRNIPSSSFSAIELIELGGDLGGDGSDSDEDLSEEIELLMTSPSKAGKMQNSLVKIADLEGEALLLSHFQLPLSSS